jgi:hypothetical protein
MTDRRIKLILNPNADMGNAWKLASDLHYLAEGFGEVDWTGTVFPTHATQLARQAAEDGYGGRHRSRGHQRPDGSGSG